MNSNVFYDIENGVCTFMIQSSKAKVVTVAIYEVLSNDAISISTIILDENNEFKESKSFVTEKDIKYLIKVTAMV